MKKLLTLLVAVLLVLTATVTMLSLVSCGTEPGTQGGNQGGNHGGSQHGKDQINHDFFLHSDIFCSFYHNNLLVVKERKLWYDEFTIYWEEFPYESC